jgi:acylpyruvate hydrolase
MRLASALHGDRPLIVRVDGDRATPLAGGREGAGPAELGRDTPISWLRSAQAAGDPIPLADLRLRPVVPNPAKVFCVGLNYVAHIEETQRQESDYPVLFTKFASTLTGPYDEISLPPEPEAIDFEGELTIVIGEPVRRATMENALDAVAGFTVANDVSMRDYQYKTHQWVQGKAWDATTPVGPALVTVDEAGDGSGLTLRTTLNGEVVQESSTDLMIFDVATLVVTISQFASLAPGDLILTGTPSGVGYRREPKLLLGDGDVLVTEVDGIGRLENRFVSER